MINHCPTHEEFDSLLSKLVTVEEELRQARKLLEAPPKKPSWCWRIWGIKPKVVVVLVLVIVSFTGAGVCGAKVVEGYFTGSDYLKQSEDAKMGYISGVRDTFSLVAANPGAIGEVIKFVNCIKPMGGQQAKGIVDNYMEAHPEKWRLAMADIIYGAVTEACKHRRKSGRP